MEKLTTEEFIKKAREVHGDKYDYSKVEYKNNYTKVCIICPEHGEFWQTPGNHLSGSKCKKCTHRSFKKITEEFVDDARKVHGDKYDYSKVEYIDAKTKVCIICPEHGEFWQKPNDHLDGHGCFKCHKKKITKILSDTTEKFIQKAREVHGDKYDYSKVEYINSKTPVCIICPEHGEFRQKPNHHLLGRGCDICGKNKRNKKNTLTTEKFIEKARKVHGDKYDYSKVEYIDTKTKVCIICPEHGEFWQKPNYHISNNGCPLCNERKLEKEIRLLLNENNIKYEYQKKFKWLGLQSLDFYLPDYNIAIECQGSQHFEPVEYFGGEKSYQEQIKRDIRKKTLCEENNVKLIYYVNKKNQYLTENTYNNKNIIIKKILN